MEQCCLCTVNIEAGVAVTEFPCHHKAHTSCFFRRAVGDGFAVTCDTCDMLIVPIEVFNQIIGPRRGDTDDAVDTEQVTNIKEVLMKDNKDFKKDAKVFKGAIRELRSARLAFARKMKDSKKKFNEEIDGFIRAVVDIRKRYINDAKGYDEYKRLVLAQRRSSYYITRLSRKWNVHMRNFYKGLIKRNDYWNMRHWLHGAPRVIRRAMRVRWIW